MILLLAYTQWDKVDDKYAVSTLIVAGVIALWSSTGLISVSYLNGKFIYL